MKTMMMLALAVAIAKPLAAQPTKAPMQLKQEDLILKWDDGPQELLIVKPNGKLVWKASKDKVVKALIAEIAKREDIIVQEAKQIEVLQAQVKALSSLPESCPSPKKLKNRRK